LPELAPYTQPGRTAVPCAHGPLQDGNTAAGRTHDDVGRARHQLLDLDARAACAVVGRRPHCRACAHAHRRGYWAASTRRRSRRGGLRAQRAHCGRREGGHRVRGVAECVGSRRARAPGEDEALLDHAALARSDGRVKVLCEQWDVTTRTRLSVARARLGCRGRGRRTARGRCSPPPPRRCRAAARWAPRCTRRQSTAEAS
jgi:hypothetical protein